MFALGDILQVVQILAFVGGGGTVVWKLGKAVAKFEQIGIQQGKEISEMKVELKALSSVIVRIAVQDENVASVERRLERMERMWDELRHGEGFVVHASK